ncbi:hypothetical protein CFP56_029691 [Quercus suber]|uniref:Uncharacterized protein n=1 Tax=Quercus suber TaxID=58331 RepID=A0AAW0JQA3_QUESU
MEFLVFLPPLFSSFTVSVDDNACEPQPCNFYDCTLYVNLLGYECGPGFSGVIGFQNSTSLPAYGFKGNSTSCTQFISDSICFDMELPGLHTYVLVGLFVGMEDVLTRYVFRRKKTTQFVYLDRKHVVQKGDTVIDATCGNGYDTFVMVNMLADELARVNDALQNTTSLLEELLNPNEVPFSHSLEGTKHRKSLANTAIAKDLVQPETMYGRLDAHLDVVVIPCKMRPGTAWTVSLIPCWLKCWMSANSALLYQWNSLFCFHLCSLPSLVSEDDNA